MTDFTPISAALGGALIGLSALVLMLGIGRGAGCSGILINSLSFKNYDGGKGAWRIAFIIGLILGPFLFSFSSLSTGLTLPVEYSFSWFTIVVGGLLVGLGAALGSGCTSGHGICGMGRFSRRSIVATISFMVTGFITVFVMNHLVVL